jgi:hypothetical protein
MAACAPSRRRARGSPAAPEAPLKFALTKPKGGVCARSPGSLALGVSLPALAQDTPTESAAAADGDAAATGVEKPKLQTQIGISGGGVLELWQDPFIGQVYGSSRLSGALTISGDLGERWFAEVEVSYVVVRTGDASDEATADTPELELLPLVPSGGVRLPAGVAELRLGLGPAFTHFAERGDEIAISGLKSGMEVKAALRLPTGLDLPSMDEGGPSSRFEIVVGRRQQPLPFIEQPGLNLSAWRVGLRLVALL